MSAIFEYVSEEKTREDSLEFLQATFCYGCGHIFRRLWKSFACNFGCCRAEKGFSRLFFLHNQFSLRKLGF